MNLADHIASIGLIDLSPHYGLISVSGTDAERFLQGQLSCDMRAIKAYNQSLTLTADGSEPNSNPNPVYPNYLGAFCNLKGRIRALFKIIRLSDQFLLQLPQALLPSTLTELKKYARFSKVELVDCSNDWVRIGLLGNVASEEIVKDLYVNNFKIENENCILIDYSLYNSENIHNTTNTNLHSKSLRHEILIPNQKNNNNIDIDMVQNTISKVNIKVNRLSLNDWILEDIRNQVPEIWIETKEMFLPHPLNLPKLGAVSFTKGCYCGQEIIARMEYLGNIKRQLQYLKTKELKALPSPGTPLGEQGIVVSSARNEHQEIELLVEGSI